MRAVLFGASGGGERLFDEISRKYEIAAVVDNDKRKWNGGAYLRGIEIEPPERCKNKDDYDVVIVTSAPGKDSITEQLLGYGVPENVIVTSFVEQPLESRRIFLECLSKLQCDVDSDVAVAEAGVFQGDFAKYINEYYGERSLYLFDTFEGFAGADVEIERKNSFSKAHCGDYGNTNEELVLKKMPHPENCIVRKGFFPDTAQGIERQFCFVNLDMDLYEPTKQGLRLFGEHMFCRGVMLVHDYFSVNFSGVRQAVDEYIKEKKSERLQLMPIGDGISIAIVGF